MKAVNSLIFVGGFGSTDKTMHSAANYLGNYFEDVSPVTFREAMQDYRFTRMVEGHPVLTHSAGMLTLVEANPDSIYAVAPPTPTKVSKLIISSIVKSYHVLNRGRELGDNQNINVFMFETAKEIALHPVVNTKALGSISIFDSFNKAIDFERRGVPTEIHQMFGDDFFAPVNQSEYQISRGLGPSVILNHEGEHDELLIRPHNVVNRIFS